MSKTLTRSKRRTWVFGWLILVSFALFTIKFLNLCNGFVLYIHINDGLMSVLVRGNKLDGNGKCKVGEEN